MTPPLRIVPWDDADLPLLNKLNTPAMTEHIGGPESAEKSVQRQRRYEQLPADKGRMFKIIEEATGEAVGSVGYWARTWRDEPVLEVGWGVLPAFQGRGIAGMAVAQAIAMARSEGRHRFLHAYPSIENMPSNAICRKLGFILVGECDFEYPKGSFMRCNGWRLDLSG